MELSKWCRDPDGTWFQCSIKPTRQGNDSADRAASYSMANGTMRRLVDAAEVSTRRRQSLGME